MGLMSSDGANDLKVVTIPKFQELQSKADGFLGRAKLAEALRDGDC